VHFLAPFLQSLVKVISSLFSVSLHANEQSGACFWDSLPRRAPAFGNSLPSDGFICLELSAPLVESCEIPSVCRVDPFGFLSALVHLWIEWCRATSSPNYQPRWRRFFRTNQVLEENWFPFTRKPLPSTRRATMFRRR